MSRRKNRNRRKVESSESVKEETIQENDQSDSEEEIPTEQIDYNEKIPGVPVENLDEFLGGAFKKMLQSIGVIGGDPMVQNQQIQTQLTPQQQYALALQLAQNQQMQNQQSVPQVQVQQPQQPVVNQQVQNPQPVQQQVVQPQQVIATMPNQSAEQASLDASALATVNNPKEETKMDTQTQMQNAQNMANTLNNLSPEEQAVFLALQAKANGNIQDSQKVMNNATINSEGEIKMNNNNNGQSNNNEGSIFDSLPDFNAKNVAIGTLAAVGAVTVGKKAYDMYKGTDADRDVSELASSFADSDVSKAAGDIFKELF